MGSTNGGEVDASLSHLRCVRCDEPAKLQCPRCLELKLERDLAAFCSQDCFKVGTLLRPAPCLAYPVQTRPFNTGSRAFASAPAGRLGGAQEAAQALARRVALLHAPRGGTQLEYAGVQVDGYPEALQNRPHARGVHRRRDAATRGA